MKKHCISVIVPTYNESANIPVIYKALQKVLSKLPYGYEIIFVDDGSHDDSSIVVSGIVRRDKNVRFIELARNFGKENALSAGLHNCGGEAAIMIDADMQHPPELIPKLIAKWEQGADVVIGVREASASEGPIKRLGSRLFNALLRRVTSIPVVNGATDFRLMDRTVIDEFNRFTERNRITRGLIDWLGFKRDYVVFKANARKHGEASYDFRKLWGLAMNSFVSLSLLPLKIAGYLGLVIVLISGPLGVFIFVEKYVLDDPRSLMITGSAALAVILMFLVGIILICLGIIAIYIGSIHEQVANRPLYVERKRRELTKGYYHGHGNKEGLGDRVEGIDGKGTEL